jgi:hypothetical protein
MTPFTFIDVALDPGLALLPARMDSPRARAMVLAICLQESELHYRRQVGGPARGYAQFERGGGVRGVLTHRASSAHALDVCRQLDIAASVDAVYTALEFCDPLAVAFARLLLWTDPGALPDQHSDADGWQLYLRTWRPGKPHPKKWAGCFGVAHDLVGESS